MVNELDNSILGVLQVLIPAFYKFLGHNIWNYQLKGGRVSAGRADPCDGFD